MSHPFVFRPGTNDEAMFRHFVAHDEYRLPERFGPEDIVVDVGVHIGSFCYVALQRGAGRVYGFEAEPSNYECARRNLEAFGDRIHLTNRAVWRSDQPGGRVPFSYCDDRANTGGGSVLWESDGPSIEAVPFDDVLEEITDGGRRRIRMLKIDCEGSEFPILLTARRLDLIDYIAGEFHEIGCARNPQIIPDHARVPGVEAFTIEALDGCLRRAGFDVAFERHGDSNLGLFYARRPLHRRTLGGRLKTFWQHLSRKHQPMSAARTAGVASRTEA
ncbi:MAG: FkbM family methyltransferase [Isosphaeraceae bacterium]|nr:FkbM family methyltransferase [Isosphaeraceae bacterium]